MDHTCFARHTTMLLLQGPAAGPYSATCPPPQTHKNQLQANRNTQQAAKLSTALLSAARADEANAVSSSCSHRPGTLAELRNQSQRNAAPVLGLALPVPRAQAAIRWRHCCCCAPARVAPGPQAALALPASAPPWGPPGLPGSRAALAAFAAAAARTARSAAAPPRAAQATTLLEDCKVLGWTVGTSRALRSSLLVLQEIAKLMQARSGYAEALPLYHHQCFST